jgi:GH24 family phage-related lysozyme (muramidase)
MPDVDERMIARSILRSEEGEPVVSYLDSLGFLTGGIGHLLAPGERGLYPLGTEIPESIRAGWFDTDTKQARLDAMFWLGPVGWNGLSPLRKALAICVAYQLGAHNLADWGPTRQHILAGNWQDVAEHLAKSLMGKQTPQRQYRMGLMWKADVLLKRYR